MSAPRPRPGRADPPLHAVIDDTIAAVATATGRSAVAVIRLSGKRAFEIGRQAIALDRVFAGLAAKGVGLWIGFQGFINMGVNVGLLPTKGLTLPLMSYGGTGVLVNCVALALVLRVDFENRKMMRGLA